MVKFLPLFLEKSFKEKLRHLVRNVVNTLLPVIFLLAVVLLHTKQLTVVDETQEINLNQDDLVDYFPGESINKVYFTPSTPAINELIENVRQTLFIVDDRVESFASEAELEHALLGNANLCYGITFHNVSNEGRLRYTIRTKNNNFRTDVTYSRDVFGSFSKRDNEYIESGFLALQNAIDRAFMSTVTLSGSADRAEVTVQYGHIPLVGDQGPQEPTRIVLVMVLLGVCFTVCSTYLLLLPLVEERACGMYEYLKLACQQSYWNEVAIFLVSFVHFLSIMLVCIAISAVGGIWDTNPAQMVYLVCLGVLFLVCLITFTFFLSATIESATIATAVALVCHFAPVLVVAIRDELAPFFVIFPVNGLLYGAHIFHNYKASGHRFEAASLFSSGYPGMEELSLFSLFVGMALGIILWAFLWFYVKNVFPGRFGTPKSKGFFLSRKYWAKLREAVCGGGTNKISITSWENPMDVSTAEGGGSFEHISLQQPDGAPAPDPVSNGGPKEERAARYLERLVHISHLRKVFKSRSSGAGVKEAVKDFSLSIYGHSITVLLGHNGAGKTTTMNIITGMLPRTSGTIAVDGEYDPDRYRQQIGFCPQHNVSFAYLNCREHVEFFGRLRGLTVDEARTEAATILEKVNLLDKADCKVPALSGGMQRRLNLANAIIGRTKLLILDEPTSGLDPESRRDIWNVLLRLRQDHTILLTTHFMEEADILGDWVAIMEYGELVAFGSPMYLKQHYGKGYTLKLLMDDRFERRATLEVIRQFVPDAIERVSVQQVCAVTLPYTALDKYSELLEQLELQKEELHIKSMSINNATLEEVFLNSSTENKAIEHHPQSFDCVDGNVSGGSSNSGNIARATTRRETANDRWIDLWNSHVAIWMKKWIHMTRNVHVYGCLIGLPLIVTICCFAFGSTNEDVAISLPGIDLHAGAIHRALGFVVVNRDNAVQHPLLRKDAISEDVQGLFPAGLELVVLENVSLVERLKNESAQDYTAYRDRVVVGIEFNVTATGTDVTVLHNNNLVHSSGIAQSVATTLLLRYYYGLAGATVEVQNVPATRKQMIDLRTPLFFTEFISIAFMVYMLQFLQVPLLEKLSGFRQLQNIKRYYWTATLVYDLTLHLVVCSLVVCIATLLDKHQALSSSAYCQIFWVLFLYGLVALMVVYIVSQCVESANTAITIMSYLTMIGAGGVFLLSDGYDNIKKNQASIWFLHIVPEFGMKHSLRVVYENQKLTVYESLSSRQRGFGNGVMSERQKEALYPVAFYVIGPIIAIVLAIVLDRIVEDMHNREMLTISIESVSVKISTLRRKMTFRRQESSDPEAGNRAAVVATGSRDEPDGSPVQYDDVDQESKTVQQLYERQDSIEEDKYALVVKDVQKNYGTYRAVKGISFAVKKGECFGLLGMNGAGKTTMFQMVSGNLPSSSGNFYMQGKKLDLKDDQPYREEYGYCPQLDALLDFMTVHQVIDYFARLKSLPNRAEVINRWLVELDILRYMDHQLRDCSGGTKRKVNTILALLGEPSVVLLDEPTTGVDPKSRHFLWNCIKTIQRHKQTILLTSHSMDECEELCDRLSIMVEGRLRCIGFIPQLKQRHGDGFNLLLKLQDGFVAASGSGEDYTELIRTIKERFGATLQEEHKGMLKFLIKPPTLRLSRLFAEAQTLKNERDDQIANYSINESSLEDIFLRFQKKQCVA
ncbi:phospholipid-transporting ATPase ABCA1 [Anopheles bellator]|uniref:phospholipid-transporting ATPase ABCA1 n=1 Tax=Anopheles bellator TaxID=139047 RepID=UPI0026492009|nr:phospholipid-transporting ATPase ABCA1 [Anopheles bellator]